MKFFAIFAILTALSTITWASDIGKKIDQMVGQELKRQEALKLAFEQFRNDEIDHREYDRQENYHRARKVRIYRTLEKYIGEYLEIRNVGEDLPFKVEPLFRALNYEALNGIHHSNFTRFAEDLLIKIIENGIRPESWHNYILENLNDSKPRLNLLAAIYPNLKTQNELQLKTKIKSKMIEELNGYFEETRRQPDLTDFVRAVIRLIKYDGFEHKHFALNSLLRLFYIKRWYREDTINLNDQLKSIENSRNLSFYLSQKILLVMAVSKLLIEEEILTQFEKCHQLETVFIVHKILPLLNKEIVDESIWNIDHQEKLQVLSSLHLQLVIWNAQLNFTAEDFKSCHIPVPKTLK